MDLAIRVESLGKRYTINRTAAATTLREQVTSGIARLLGQRSDVGELLPHDEADPRSPEQEYWALKDVSFEVMTGERIGIIGQNGAGKSTLLKILSRVTSPTEGRVEIRGKVSSLLEVGTGFHPELTGRENIYLNGAILGMSRQEIRKKLDQIVSFSGVERFIDTPVKHYSSGMYVRLAFSVSAWLDPDILILDEVLSVGDQAFQRKCGERMRELTREGRTVIVVSHSMATVNQMCQKALYLERGRVISFDAVQDATVEYQRDVVE
jgi:lipopolysaccharide transport system ATP-binding protein